MCGVGSGPEPAGSWMSKREQDAPFEESVKELIFPAVASTAAAAWWGRRGRDDLSTSTSNAFGLSQELQPLHPC